MNYLVNQIEHVFILDNSCFRLNCLGPLCHHLNWLQIWPPDGATCIDYKSISCNFGHKVVPPASVKNWATKQPSNTCIHSKFGHQVAPLALVPKLAIRWQHFQMLTIWPPGWVTCIFTLPWIALLALSEVLSCIPDICYFFSTVTIFG